MQTALTDCCASTSPKGPISACTAPTRLQPWPPPSTRGPERRLIGRHPQRRLTGFSYQPTKIVLRRPLESALRTAIRMMDDVVGLSGYERHVESVEHDAGLQIGREGPSDDPARPGVENDREVEKAGQRRQEGDVGHPQLVRPLGHEVATDEIAGGMMVSRLSRRDRHASAPADACNPARPHQPSNPLPADRETI